MTELTLAWAALFALRAAVYAVLIAAGRVGWLAAASIAMGWPAFGLLHVRSATATCPKRLEQLGAPDAAARRPEPSLSAPVDVGPVALQRAQPRALAGRDQAATAAPARPSRRRRARRARARRSTPARTRSGARGRSSPGCARRSRAGRARARPRRGRASIDRVGRSATPPRAGARGRCGSVTQQHAGRSARAGTPSAVAWSAAKRGRVPVRARARR